MLSSRPVSPLILGFAGLTLDARTKALFEQLNPAGYILFRRNCESREQVEALCAELTELSSLPTPLIFIDQEGGRVNRITWEPYMAPAGAKLGEIYAQDPARALKAAELNGYLLGAQLWAYGITVNCLPVADLQLPGTSNVIGDRAFSADPAAVGALCGATISGLLAGGVWPVIKHAPGHGRALLDSHYELPRVSADLDTLAADFKPFEMNNIVPFVMTAHVLYEALDDTACATQSATVIQGYLRQKLGMTGVMLADDMFMQALTGNLQQRIQKSLVAGCDLAICGSTSLDGRFSTEHWQQLETLTDLPPVSPELLAQLAALPARGMPQADTLKEAFEFMQEVLAA